MGSRKWLVFSCLLGLLAAMMTAVVLFCVQLDEIDRVKSGPRRFALRAQSSASGILTFTFPPSLATSRSSTQEIQVAVVQSDKPQLYEIMVPAGVYSAVRLDIPMPGAQLVVHSAKIFRPDGELIGGFTLRGSERSTEVTSTKFGKAGIQLSVGHKVSAESPASLKFGQANAALFEHSWSYLFEACIMPSLFVLCSVSVFLFVGPGAAAAAQWGWRALSASIPGRGLVLSVITLVATLASTYPVVFFGKSFVSPLYGNWLLYPRFDTLPGFSAEEGVEVVSSDVGATPWVMMPYAKVEHEAVFFHREFPLFNRYAQAGLPLFGQGQAMFGDPLHLLPLLYPNSAEAWDIKFVLARWLFCLGIALLVQLLTGSLLCGGVIGASCAFMGFYLFRVNHPSYFSIPYAPWIMLSWLLLGRQQGRRWMSVFLGLMALSSISHLCAGATKEGIIVFLGAQLTGMLLYLSQHTTISRRVIIHTLLINLSLLCLSCPYWSTFLTSLANASTSYDEPFVAVLGVDAIAGMFDNSFQQLVGPLLYPSSNMFIFAGVLWSVVCAPRLRTNLAYCSLLLSVGIASVFCFGLIPVDVLIQLPLIKNIYHVGACFALWLLVVLPLLAGFGFCELLKGSLTATRAAVFVLLFIILFTPFVLRLQSLQPITETALPLAGAVVIAVLCSLLCPLAFTLLRGNRSKEWRLGAVGCCFCLFIVSHIRFGMHLQTGIASLDNLILNARNRANFSYVSPGLELVQTAVKNSPGRTFGLGYTPAPGYLAIDGLETIFSADALMNGYYTGLLDAMGIPRASERGWGRVITRESYPKAMRALDLINARYMLTNPDELPFQGAQVLGRSDFAVFDRQSAWPRAFFSDEFSTYDSLATFQTILQSDAGTRPFAMISADDYPAEIHQFVRMASTPSTDRVVSVAYDYKLTTNSTTFKVDATGPGIAALHEAYTRDEFVASLNGRDVGVFRVNHAFKGVIIPAAGTFEVSIRYRPRFFSLSWLVAAIGVLILRALVKRLSANCWS